MNIPIGKHEVTITEANFTMIGDKEAIRFLFTLGEENGEFLIWLTPKSFGIARRSLKLCGFDVDTRDLDELAQDPALLDGNKVVVLAEEYNGKLRCQVLLGYDVPKERLSAIQKGLRDAKGDGNGKVKKGGVAKAAPAPTSEYPYDGASTDPDDIPF